MNNNLVTKKNKFYDIIIFLVIFGLLNLLINISFQGLGNVKAEKIIVDSNGKGNYVLIQSAIENASPKDTIYVWAGTYHENLIIDKPLTLIGNGTINTIIDGDKNGDVIYIISDNVKIQGFTISNAGKRNNPFFDSGIKLNTVENVIIINNNCSNNWDGIALYHSNSNMIINNNCSNNEFGINLNGSMNNKINNNICNINSWGILISSLSQNNFISDNECNFNINGIEIYSSNLNEINNNTCTSNNLHGLKILWSDKNIIENNRFELNKKVDIYIDANSEDNKFYNNTGKIYYQRFNDFDINLFYYIGIISIFIIFLILYMNRKKIKKKFNNEDK